MGLGKGWFSQGEKLAMGDNPNERDVSVPNNVFDPEYNTLPQGDTTGDRQPQPGSQTSANPLFEDYARTAGAPDGRVVVPGGADQPVVVADGRVVSGRGGDVIINHANEVNVYYGGREVPRQVAQVEYAGTQYYDQGGGQTYIRIGDSAGPIYGHRPLYGQAANDMFYSHRYGRPMPVRGGHHGGGVVVDQYGGRTPNVYTRDSSIYGGQGGVRFEDSETMVSDGAIVTTGGNRGPGFRDVAAVGVAILNSPNFPVLIGRGGGSRGRPAPVVQFPIGGQGYGHPGYGNPGYGRPGYGTPPFVPGGGRNIEIATNGRVPNVHDRQSTVAGGDFGVIFQDSSTTISNGGIIQEQPSGPSFRDIAAVGVAVLNSPNFGALIGRDGGGRNHRGGDGNFYNQQLAAERRQIAMQRSQAARDRAYANRRYG